MPRDASGTSHNKIAKTKMVDLQRPPTKKALPRRTHGWAYCGARAASGVFIGGRDLAAASTLTPTPHNACGMHDLTQCYVARAVALTHFPLSKHP